MLRAMSEFQVRPLEDRDRDAFLTNIALTYNDGVELPVERRELKDRNAYVVERDGRIFGGLLSLDFHTNRGKAVLRTGAIAAVHVDPSARRSGAGTALMAGIVRLLRDEGVPMSSLYAFRETWYRKAGYEVCGKRIQILCPMHRLPKADSGLPIQRLKPSDWQLIAPTYEAFAKARSGYNIRTEAMWGRVLNENKPNAIYAAGDPIEGYVAISHQTVFWEQQHLTEVVWTTERGYRACLEIMAMLGINKTQLSWYEPSDSPFYATYMDQGIETKVVRQIMYRINDVPTCLMALQTEESGEFAVEVNDDVIPENDGVWRVRFGPDGVEVSQGGQPDFTIDVRHWCQAFLGEPSLLDLARNGLVQVHDGRGLSAASRLLPPSPTVCNDFF